MDGIRTMHSLVSACTSMGQVKDYEDQLSHSRNHCDMSYLQIRRLLF